ncbi:MAG: rhodanese-like domain-containing protein [Candidatus Moraniibacteriota bacterium]
MTHPIHVICAAVAGRSEGRVVLLLAALMFGGAAVMLGKLWYENRPASPTETSPSTTLTELRTISPENILDRIKRGEDMRFIDVRPRAVFEQYHLIDSEWLGLAEIATFSAPTGQLVVIVHGDENSNDQLREIHERFSSKQMTFAFLEGGIRQWIAKGGNVIAESNPDSYIDRTKVITIQPDKVQELERTLVRSVILDVRSESDYARGHIPGALNLPAARLEKERRSIPSGSLFVYGANENETFQAGTRLFDMGFIGLRVISGGFAAWKEKGLPTEPVTK